MGRWGIRSLETRVGRESSISEKIKGSAWGNWDPQVGQQPFRPNPNRAGDHTTTLRRLLIGAGKAISHPWLVI